eukprot:354498-Chlamydomonas_euryale.AAC.3
MKPPSCCLGRCPFSHPTSHSHSHSHRMRGHDAPTAWHHRPAGWGDVVHAVTCRWMSDCEGQGGAPGSRGRS